MNEYDVYVGETNGIVARTRQHLGPDAKVREDWGELANRAEHDHESVRQLIIGNEHFNKSLTLDVENRMMQYLLGSDAVSHLNNRRSNAQGDYYTRKEFDSLFSSIWRSLSTMRPEIFPSETVVKDSALFKASPFHRLTDEQIEAEEMVLQAIQEALIASASADALADGQFGKLILVEGAAGTGKTVLISHLFYRIARELGPRGLLDDEGLVDLFRENANRADRLSAFILIKHNEQRHVYNQVATKLGLQKEADQVVLKPVTFIDRYSAPRFDANGKRMQRGDVFAPCGRADIALVDEAHLLLTQKDQSYSGYNMLLDIMRRAKVTVAVFDPKQILQAKQQWTDDDLVQLVGAYDGASNGERSVILSTGEHFSCASVQLRRQMRIAADDETIRWIEDFADGRGIGAIPRSEKKGFPEGQQPYDLRVFSSPVDLFLAIREKAADDEGKGLSRVLATYDWAYKDDKPHEGTPDSMWDVELHLDYDGQWKMGLAADDPNGFVEGEDASQPTRFCHPWNYCLVKRSSTKAEEEISWAEKPETIDEIGSTYTIQGFDLNYAGVIIGPSVKYREGRIVFDAAASKNAKATNKRESKYDYSEKNLRNELGVLLKRGVHGLYLFAVDPELQAALMRAQEGHAA